MRPFSSFVVRESNVSKQVVPILPAILRDRVHLPESMIQSHVSALLAVYAGASVLVSPLCGIVADRAQSRQTPFLLGLIMLLLATILLFTATSVPVLTIARLAQGGSSAFVWTIGLALCMDTVGPSNLGKAIGSIFSFVSVGELFAPTLGGLLYEKGGYIAVAGLSAGLLAIDFLMRVLLIEKKIAAKYGVEVDRPAEQDQNDDDPEQSAHDETSPLLSNAPKNEKDDTFLIRTPQPYLIRKWPILACFRSGSLLAALLIAFVQATLLGSFDATIPTHAKDLFNFDSLRSGLLFGPLGVLNCIVGPIAGWALDKYGSKPLAVLGYTTLVPALAILRIPKPEPYPQQAYLYGGLLALSGIGLAIIGAPSIVEAGAVVEKFHKRNPGFFGELGPYAQLYGFNSLVFSAGLTFGPLVSGGLKDSIGYGNMNAVLAGLSGVTGVICYLFLGGYPACLRKNN